jgi:hypothetical protein
MEGQQFSDGCCREMINDRWNFADREFRINLISRSFVIIFKFPFFPTPAPRKKWLVERRGCPKVKKKVGP